MEFSTSIRPNKIFSSQIFMKCFEDLFVRGESDFAEELDMGILSHIIEKYPLVPAKGGDTGKLMEWSDTTYLVHVLNGMIISGKILENYFLTNNGGKEIEHEHEIESYIRLFFAAVALHDADKLFNEGQQGAENLDIVLARHKQEIVKICSYYLKGLGESDSWWGDISYIILRTENRSMELANSIETKLDRSLLATISQYSKLADQTGGIKKSYSDAEIYKELVKLLEKHEVKVNFLNFSILPQVLLEGKVREEFKKFIGSSRIIVETPTAIFYSGETLREEDVKTIRRNFEEKINVTTGTDLSENIRSSLKSFSPSNNSIRLGFVKEMRPTEDIVKEYVETFSGKLLLYLNCKERGSNYPDLDLRLRQIGINMTRSKGLIFLSTGEESLEEGDVIDEKTRKLGLIACARRVEYEINPNLWNKDLDSLSNNNIAKTIISNNGKDIILSNELILKKTLLSLAYSAAFSNAPLEEIESTFCNIISSISKSLMEKYDNAIGDLPDFSGFFDAVTGKIKFVKDVPDKTEICIQCGKIGTNSLKAENAFGYKATAGTGLKVTVLKYDDKFNGKICSYCIKENSLRKSQINGDAKGFLTLSIYLGDYVAPVDVDQVMNNIIVGVNQNGQWKLELEEETGVIVRIGSTKHVLQAHTTIFIEKPKKTKAFTEIEGEFNLLLNILRLTEQTGFKIRISSLFANLLAFESMFLWENSPSWVKVLGFDAIRINRIKSALDDLELMKSIADFNRSKKSSLGVEFVIKNALRGKRGMLFALWTKFSGSDYTNLNKLEPIKTKFETYIEKYKNEVRKMEIDLMVTEACKLVNEGPVSNSDNTWLVRKGFEIYNRNIKKPESEIIQMVSGRILDFVNRKAFSRSHNNEYALKFSTEFVKNLKKEFHGRIPPSESQKDIIAQFGLMFNMAKWSQIMEAKRNKDEKKNNTGDENKNNTGDEKNE